MAIMKKVDPKRILKENKEENKVPTLKV